MIRKASLTVSVIWCLVLSMTLLAQGISGSIIVSAIFYYLLVVGGCIVYPLVALCYRRNGVETSIHSIEGFDDTSNHGILHNSAELTNAITTIYDVPEGCNIEDPNAVVASRREIPNCHRLFFLDNLKTFLTVIVVSHHVGSAFGGAGANSWFLIVGNYDSVFNQLIRWMLQLNQGYFMSLFFFVSAYFTPSSYEKKGKWYFHKDKARRLSLPLIGITFVISPISLIIALGIVGYPVYYFPTIGHGWFILWLILLNVVYSTIYEADESEKATINEILSNPEDESDGHTPARPAEQRTIPFPDTFKRVFTGTMICGFFMFAVATLINFRAFMGMPITIGSLICNLLFFYLGTCSKRYGWLEKSLREQLDIPVWLLRLSVVSEAGTMCAISFPLEGENNAWALLYIPVAGLFCVDMSLMLLELFQSYADFSTPITRLFSDAAYTVYLIHPIVVTGLTTIFVAIYRAGNFGSEIEFDDGFFYTASSTRLVGPDNGGGTLLLGWVTVNILSHLLVWPLAWQLKQLPGFCQIL